MKGKRLSRARPSYSNTTSNIRQWSSHRSSTSSRGIRSCWRRKIFNCSMSWGIIGLRTTSARQRCSLSVWSRLRLRPTPLRQNFKLSHRTSQNMSLQGTNSSRASKRVNLQASNQSRRQSKRRARHWARHRARHRARHWAKYRARHSRNPKRHRHRHNQRPRLSPRPSHSHSPRNKTKSSHSSQQRSHLAPQQKR